ncbi:glycosyltransferase [Robiginitalea sp. IMCC43444]|uniref:glycosyltransferase n=1 Tax=Robiginitalea sp. IMCC43444 TaxID=3459121 RepID=UPI0040412EEB
MKKSILFMIHNMNIGGTEKSLLSLISNMPQDDYDITLLLLQYEGGYLNSIPDWVKVETLEGFSRMKSIIYEPPLKNILMSVRRLNISQAFRLTYVYFQSKITKNWDHFYRYSLRKTEFKNSYDFAVAYAGPSDFISYFILKKVNSRVKYQWIHFDVKKLGLNKNFGNKYYNKFDRIFCVSEGSKKEILNLFPLLDCKIEVFENIIIPDELNSLANEGETFIDDIKGVRIVTLGRLTEEKGQILIPKVARLLKNNGKDFRWYCIGDGIMRSKIESVIQTENVANEVIMIGQKINPYAYLKNADLYVQTSFHEGYGLTIMEARTFNLPMVITNVASANELINNGVNGIIVESTVSDLFRAINYLLENKDIRIAFSESLKADNDYLRNNHISKINLIFNTVNLN